MENLVESRDVNLKVYSFGEKNKLSLTREDPYGLWKFSLERGFVPDMLNGNFTSISEAEKFLELYYLKSKKDKP